MNLTKRECSKLEASARRGARLLDRERPNWYKTNSIRITTLDLSNPCKCVLGQAFHAEVGTIALSALPSITSRNGYRIGRYKLFGLAGWSTMRRVRGVTIEQWYGFDAPHPSQARLNLAYDMLGWYWKEEIRARRHAAARA